MGVNASAARLRTAASNLRHRKEDVLMAMSHSNRASSESRKVSAPMDNWESVSVTINFNNLPFSSRRRSKFVRRSNIRRS